MKSLIVSFVILVIAASCLADTTWVSGSVTGVWNATGSPYVIADSAWVEPGTTLYIGQGVDIVLTDSYLGGVFAAEGLESSQIFFSGYPDGTMRFSGDFNWCNFENLEMLCESANFLDGSIANCHLVSETDTLKNLMNIYLDDISFDCGANLTNCLITGSGNISPTTIGGDYQLANLLNCTIAGDYELSGEGIPPATTSWVNIYNSILFGIPTIDVNNLRCQKSLLCNVVNTGYVVFYTDTIWGDPLFLDAPGEDFHINELSAAIDYGDSIVDDPPYFLLDAPAFDIEYNSRPFGDGWDVGAYEYVGVKVEERPQMPDGISISAYPNPFNSAITIALDIPVGDGSPVPISVEIYDVNGRKIKTVTELVEVPVGEALVASRGVGSSVKEREGTSPAPTANAVVWRPAPSIGSGVYLVRARFDPSASSGHRMLSEREDDAVSKRVVYLK